MDKYFIFTILNAGLTQWELFHCNYMRWDSTLLHIMATLSHWSQSSSEHGNQPSKMQESGLRDNLLGKCNKWQVIHAGPWGKDFQNMGIQGSGGLSQLGRYVAVPLWRTDPAYLEKIIRIYQCTSCLFYGHL